MAQTLKSPLLGIEERKEYVGAPLLPKKVEKVSNTVKCSCCKQELSYPEGAFCIKCPQCQSITAVKELSTLICVRCRNKMIFPAGTPSVQCVCGQIYGVNA
jgi:LSD1 subclass zinc finger protein